MVKNLLIDKAKHWCGFWVFPNFLREPAKISPGFYPKQVYARMFKNRVFKTIKHFGGVAQM